MVWFREHMFWLLVVILFSWIYRRMHDRRELHLKSQRKPRLDDQPEPERE